MVALELLLQPELRRLFRQQMLSVHLFHIRSWFACPARASALHHSHALVEAQHQVHVLNGHTARAFDEVVDGREDDQLVAIETDSDVTEVRKRYVLRCWNVIDHSNERLL